MTKNSMHVHGCSILELQEETSVLERLTSLPL